MSRISNRQLAITFIATRLSAEMIMVSGDTIRYGADRFWCIFFAKLVVLALYLPLIFLTLRFKEDNFLTAALRRSRIYGVMLGFLFSLSLVAVTVNTVLNLQLYIADTLLNSMLPVFGFLIIIAAALYGAAKGVSAITRTAIFASSFFAVLIVLIVITMFDNLNTIYLYPSFIEDGNYFFRCLLSEVGANSEMLIFAVLCANVREKPNKTILYYLPAVFIILEIVNLIYNLILGPYLSSVEYPLYVISSMSDIVVFQRLDGIDAIVWLFCGIIKIALLTACVYQIYTTSVKQTREVNKYLFLFIYALFILALCWFIGTKREYYDLLEKIMQTGAHIVIAGMLIPLLVLITGKKKAKKESEAAKIEKEN